MAEPEEQGIVVGVEEAQERFEEQVDAAHAGALVAIESKRIGARILPCLAREVSE